MARKLLHVDTNDVIQKYRAGVPVKDIARDLGVDISVIYSRLDSAGVSREWRKILDPETVANLYADGHGVKEIGRMFGVSDYPVRVALRSKGVTIRGRLEQMRIARERLMPTILSMHMAGETASAIATKVGMSATNICGILDRQGLDRHGRRIDLPVADICRLHDSGLSIAEIADRYGVTDKVIVRIFDQNGIAYRRSRMEHRRFKASIAGFDIASAKSMFDSGIGIRGIADKFNLPTTTIALAFKEAGIGLRDRSAQQFARMSRYSPEERAAITRAANIAATGRTVPMTTKLLAANTNYKRMSKRRSATEDVFVTMLSDRGIITDQQTAIGPYNCDLTTDSVAVEVWGGYWHFYGEHAARNEERFRYIMNAGWNVIILVVIADRYPLTGNVADYVVSEIQRLRRNPPTIREYRMIWGAGDFTSGGSLDDEKLAFVRPLVRPRN